MCIVGRKVCGEMLRGATFLPSEAFMTLGERKREKKKKDFKRIFFERRAEKDIKTDQRNSWKWKKKKNRERKKKKRRRKSSCSNIG